MAIWNILHISDLHIGDVSGHSAKHPEMLRTGFYKQFSEDLSASVQQHLDKEALGKVDALVVTGDFVDKGKVKNFKHALAVVSHLAKCLAVDMNSVVGCIGNHDVDLAQFRKVSEAKGKAGVNRFLKNLGNGSALKALKAGHLCDAQKGIWILAVDATRHCGRTEIKPGELSVSDIEEIEGALSEDGCPVLETDLLIIASHYPLNDYSELGKCDRLDEHIWRGGMTLAKQIERIRASAPTLWLSGDIHVELNHEHNGIYHVTAGHFGGSKVVEGSTQRHEATLITVTSDKSTSSITKFQFNPRGHLHDGFSGIWERLESQPLGSPTPRLRSAKSGKPSKKNTDLPHSERIQLLENIAKSNAVAEAVSLQEAILRSIEEQELYTLGRFQTSSDFATLGWVSIGPLLCRELLPVVVEHIYLWIKSQAERLGLDVGANDVVLLGIDCWGAILASLVSVRGGWRNFCIAGRGRGTLHTAFERISTDPVMSVSESGLTILLTDVIGSGGTIQRIFDEFSTAFEGRTLKPRCRWLAACILCDDKCVSRMPLKFIDAIGAACTQVRLPIVSNALLPSDRILPPLINLV